MLTETKIEATPDPIGRDWLAGHLESHCAQIIDDSCQALVMSGNVVAQNALDANQMREHYRQILDDVTASLRAGAIRIDDSYKLTAWEIGTTRAMEGIHPGESLQAGSIFYETVLKAITLVLPAEPAAVDVFELAALALQASISHRVREAFAVYTSFLLNKVFEAQTEERRRIARELHDEIGHSISVAHHQLELNELYRDVDSEKAREKIRTAHRAVRDAMTSLRSVATGLHSSGPRKTMESVLLGAIREIDTTGIDVRVRVNGDEAWADSHVLDECTLLLREAARNALEHARPTLLIVNVDITPENIRAMVEDDGDGFDQGRFASSGLGLSVMHERAEQLGGSVHVQSQIGAGTRVQCILPLKPAQR